MRRLLLTLAALGTLLAGVALFPILTPRAGAQATGIHKIQHVIIIMQENRSFDSYFGTYPGAQGIPMQNGTPTVCVPDPTTGQCVKPFHDTRDENSGGPHDATAASADIHGGAMNGFIAEQRGARKQSCATTNPTCGDPTGVSPDVLGYHTTADIPNYWSYAQHFVLQDQMFEPVASWSFPQHLSLVSVWSARCAAGNPTACVDAIQGPPQRNAANPTPFAWTDITYLLAKNGVTWGYYLDHGASALAYGGGTGVPLIWNTLPGFQDVHTDNQVNNIQNLDNFYAQAKKGTLPNVSWIIPDIADSEHPPALVSQGQSYVTNLINTVMNSPEWNSTAIFVSWDDWGGFYDHVVPPTVDALGYGLRVPGLLISPYARHGYIDHQTLSHDAYLKFIEDDFLGGQRLDPKSDGRPDSRPTVRENNPQLGDLATEFNFNQPPRAPMLLPVHPATDLVAPARPPQFGGNPQRTCAAPATAACTLLAYGRVTAVDGQTVVLVDPAGKTVTVTLAANATLTPRAAPARQVGFGPRDYAAFYGTAGAATAARVLYSLSPMPAIAKQYSSGSAPTGTGGTSTAGGQRVTLTGTVTWSLPRRRLLGMQATGGTQVVVHLPPSAVYVENGKRLFEAPELVAHEPLAIVARQLADGSYRAVRVVLGS